MWKPCCPRFVSMKNGVFIQRLTGFFFFIHGASCMPTNCRLWGIRNKGASVISLHISKRYYMKKNKISCQGCSRNITSGHQIFKSNNMTISLIISNRVPKFIMPFHTHPSRSYSIEVIHYSSCPHSQK